jgi:hypothetical protein
LCRRTVVSRHETPRVCREVREVVLPGISESKCSRWRIWSILDSSCRHPISLFCWSCVAIRNSQSSCIKTRWKSMFTHDMGQWLIKGLGKKKSPPHWYIRPLSSFRSPASGNEVKIATNTGYGVHTGHFVIPFHSIPGLVS